MENQNKINLPEQIDSDIVNITTALNSLAINYRNLAGVAKQQIQELESLRKENAQLKAKLEPEKEGA